MDGQPRTRVKLLMADVAFKMFRFLMLDQDFLIVELSVAIPEFIKLYDGYDAQEHHKNSQIK